MDKDRNSRQERPGGDSMEKQTLELYRLYRLASQGDADAQYRLGMRYLNGIGTPQDIRLAYIWLGKAADRNHEQARQDLGHLRTAGIEKAVIAAGIPTDAGIPDNAVPAPAGYVQPEADQPAAFSSGTVSKPEPVLSSEAAPVQTQPVPPVQPVQANQEPVPVLRPDPMPVPTAVSKSSARKPVPFSRQRGSTEQDDTGASPMKKVFWGVVVLVAIVVAGWFFKGSFWGSGKTVEDKPVSNKAVILTDKDQKQIAQKVFDKHYGEGTYKNGCWMTGENACMKFKQVNAVPIKGTSLYNLYVYAYSTTGPGRIDAYTVEVDANTPNEFRVLTSSTGMMAEPSDGRKTWKFAKGGRSWSVDSLKEHDGVRDTIRSTYTIIGTDIRSNRVLLKSEPVVVENTDESQSTTSETTPGATKPADNKNVERKPEEGTAKQPDNEDRIGQKIKSLSR